MTPELAIIRQFHFDAGQVTLFRDPESAEAYANHVQEVFGVPHYVRRLTGRQVLEQDRERPLGKPRSTTNGLTGRNEPGIDPDIVRLILDLIDN
jgi:hypothetical protein